MSRVFAIAHNTFRETLRDRVLYSLLFFSLGVIALSLVTEEITIGDADKMVRSVGFGAIRIFGSVFSLFLGIGLVYKELERKTIYTIASKPIPRWMFVVGKYLGLMGVIAVQLVAMSAIYALALTVQQGAPGPWLLTCMAVLYVELGLLTAWALLFSTYSSPIVASLFSAAVLVIGNLADDIWLFGSQAESESLRQASEILYWCLPNFSLFNVYDAGVHLLPIQADHVVGALGYGVGYIVALLAAGSLIFSRRDFK